jgi:hypothetical protein
LIIQGWRDIRQDWLRRTDIAMPVASFDQSLPLDFYRWFRSIDRTKRLSSRSHPLNYRLRRRIRSGVSSAAQYAWASPVGGQLTNALSFSQPVSISVKEDGHYQVSRTAVSSRLVIFDPSSADVDSRLCGIAKKTLTAIAKHRILSFLLLRRTQRFEEYSRGSSTR